MGVQGFRRARIQFNERYDGYGLVSGLYRRLFELAEQFRASDNSITLIENFPPPKADVLGYFDSDDSSPQRFAKVNGFLSDLQPNSYEVTFR